MTTPPYPQITVTDGLTETWKGWPRNCKSFRPGSDDPNDYISSCDWYAESWGPLPADQLVFRLSEFSREGEQLLDQHVTEAQLDAKLQSTDNDTFFRCFFVSSQNADRASRSSYIRRFYSYCHTPFDTAVSMSHYVGLGFQCYMYREPGETSGNIFHAWIKCPVSIHRDAANQNLDLFAMPHKEIMEHDTKTFFTIQRGPAVYVQFDCDTGKANILTMDLAEMHKAVCGAARQHGASTDPFVFLAAFLSSLTNSMRKTVENWLGNEVSLQNMILSHENGSHAQKLETLSVDYRVYLLCSETVKALAQAALDMKAEHRQLLERVSNMDEQTFANVDDDFVRLNKSLTELLRGINYMLQITQRNIEALLGFASLRNGVEMKEMTMATSSLAMDAKRDSEVMKTITVVTMIFLPATFVSTLLSMGIFNFDFDNDRGGKLVISKDGWVFIAVAVPLTLLTILFSWLYMYRVARKREKQEAEAAARMKELQGAVGGPAPDPVANPPPPPTNPGPPPMSHITKMMGRTVPPVAIGPAAPFHAKSYRMENGDYPPSVTDIYGNGEHVPIPNYGNTEHVPMERWKSTSSDSSRRRKL